MESIQQEDFGKYQYSIDFIYNGNPYLNRSFFTECLLEKVDKSALIGFAVNIAESFLKTENKLLSEGKISHVRLYDINKNLLVAND